MQQCVARPTATKTALPEHDGVFRTLFENSADAQFLSEGDIYVDCNNAALTMMGCSQKADIVGHHVCEFSPPAQPDGRASSDKARDVLSIAVAKGNQRFEWVHRRRDGIDFTTEVSLAALSVNSGPLLHRVVREMTNRDRSPSVLEENELRYKESEARFKQLFDSVIDGITVRDAQTLELLDANHRYCEMSGYTLEELRKLPLGGLREGESVDDRRKRHAAHNARVARGGSSLLELENKRKDGTTYWVELNVTRITIKNRECLLSVARDVTERKTAEMALRRSEEAAQRLAQETGVIAEIGRIIGSSLDIEEAYERFAEEARKLIPFDRIMISVINQQERTLATAYAAGTEMASRRKWEAFPLAGSITEEMMDTGEPVVFHPESLEDVRDRSPVLVPSFEAGLRSTLFVPLRARGEIIGSVALWSKQDRAYGEQDIRLAQSVAGQIAGAIVNAQLFREHKRVEEALRESEARFRQLFENVNDGISVRDATTFELLDANRRYCEMGGWTLDEAKRLLIEDLNAHGADGGLRSHTLAHSGRTANGAPDLFESMGKRKDGSTFWVELNVTRIRMGTRDCLLSVARDITKRKQLEAQLVQAQKLQSIGQLAAGIAHEINTPTQYVGANIHFLQEAFGKVMSLAEKDRELFEAVRAEMPVDALVKEIERTIEKAGIAYLMEEIPKAIHDSMEGVERIANIVSAVGGFSHPGAKEKQLVDINKGIEDTLTVSRNAWKRVAKVVTDFDPDLPLVPCLPGELNQAILNIIVNGAQAIEEKNGTSTEKGCIRISTRGLDGWVEIRISDTGPGIPEEIRSRIFDPFFTTKEVGKGTGQGLAIAHSIIADKHKGIIYFDTAPGEGTTFTVQMPLNDGEK